MKYAGYVILILLFIYFVFLKPYLILHKVEVRLEGLEINLKEKSLKLREFLVFIPKFRKDTYFLRAEDVFFHKNELKVKEFSLINTSKKVGEKPFDYDLSTLTKSLNQFNISVERAYISINSLPHLESITVFVGKTQLSNRKIFSHTPTIAYYIKKDRLRRIEVSVREAYLDGPTFNLVSSDVIGENYFFDLSGRWEGKKGSFGATGLVYLRGIPIDPIKVSAKGYVSYTTVEADLELQANSIRLGERKYENLKGAGNYKYIWRKQNRFLSSFGGEGIDGAIEYNVSSGILELSLNRLSIDERLLQTKRKLRGIFSGHLLANLPKKNVKLEGDIHGLTIENILLNNARIRSEINYDKRKEGEIDFSSDLLYVKGMFYERDFVGKLGIKGFPYLDHRVSATVFYEGNLYYLKGNLESVGEGSLSNLSLYGRKLGKFRFSLSFKNPSYQIIGEGEGFRLKASGNITEKTSEGNINLTNFSFKEKDLEVSDLTGQVFFQISGEETKLKGKAEGTVKGEGLEVKTLSEFNLSRWKERLRGEFISNLRNIKHGNFEFKDGLLKGEVRDEEVILSYSIEEKLKGSGKLSLKDFSFSTQGEWDGQIGESSLRLSYRLQRTGEGSITGNIKGNAKVKGLSIPVDSNLQLVKGSIRASFREFRTQKGLLTVDFGRIDLEDGKINFKGASVKLNSEEVIKVLPAEGLFNLKGRELELPDIRVYGYANGQARVFYKPASGFNLVSEGQVDLAKASKLIRSKTQTALVGNLYYYLNTDGEKLNIVLLSKEPVELRSRYLGSPLMGTAYFFGDGRVFKGSVSLAGNSSSLRIDAEGTEKRLIAHFYLDKLPVIYKDMNLRGNVLLRGKGSLTTDYKNLNLSSELGLGGIVEVRSFPKQKGREKRELYERVNLDITLSSYEPLRIYIPEGYTYGFLDGYLGGKLSDPNYKIKFFLSGGELRYFNRKFHVKSGTYELSKKEKEINLLIASSLPEYVVLIDLRGDTEYPKVLLRSEPPKEPRQILTDLISGGGKAEGLVALGDILVSTAGLTRGLERTLGTEVGISVSPHLGSSGEVGISTKISKDITDRLSVEYQQSTLKNPRESYVGGDAKISGGASIGGRINSDRSKEVRLRVRGKFNF